MFGFRHALAELQALARQLTQALAGLTARTTVAEERANELSADLGRVLQELAVERARSSEVQFLRSRVQALEEIIAKSQADAQLRIMALVNRPAEVFVAEQTRQREGKSPAPVKDGFRSDPPVEMLDTIIMPETPRPREGETKVVSPAEEVPLSLDGTAGAAMVDLYNNWPSDSSVPIEKPS